MLDAGYMGTMKQPPITYRSLLLVAIPHDEPLNPLATAVDRQGQPSIGLITVTIANGTLAIS